MAPVTRIFWLCKPHCHDARPVKVGQRTQRVVPGDPYSSRPIDPETVWFCEHIEQPEAST